ncbi:MAG: hypothetical protein QM778_24185 [Myxococcales bacterium]
MTCCGLFFGTESTQGNCLLATPITKNKDAFPYFPYSTPPTPNQTKQIYCRIYSHTPYTQSIEYLVYVSPPLVNGVFPSTPVLQTQFGVGGNWVVSGNRYYKQGTFLFTPTQPQVMSGICMLVKANPMGLADCACPTGFTDLGLQPLCAIYDRPW